MHMNGSNNISVLKIRDILMVTMPPDPDDSTVAALQENVLGAMERYAAKGLVLDLSAVETLDSFFARTVSETAQMVSLMGGQAAGTTTGVTIDPPVVVAPVFAGPLGGLCGLGFMPLFLFAGMAWLIVLVPRCRAILRR